MSVFPTHEHFAVISTRTVTIPGDRRSIEAPGHGYPEHDEEITHYQTFKDEPALIAYLSRLSDRERSCIYVINAKPVSIRTETKIVIEPT